MMNAKQEPTMKTHGIVVESAIGNLKINVNAGRIGVDTESLRTMINGEEFYAHALLECRDGAWTTHRTPNGNESAAGIDVRYNRSEVGAASRKAPKKICDTVRAAILTAVVPYIEAHPELLTAAAQEELRAESRSLKNAIEALDAQRAKLVAQLAEVNAKIGTEVA